MKTVREKLQCYRKSLRSKIICKMKAVDLDNADYEFQQTLLMITNQKKYPTVPLLISHFDFSNYKAGQFMRWLQKKGKRV